MSKVLRWWMAFVAVIAAPLNKPKP